MSGLVEGALAGYGADLLLGQLLKSLKLYKESDGNLRGLQELLLRLHEPVKQLTAREEVGGVADPARNWLECIRCELERASALVQKSDGQSRFNLVSRIATSKKLMQCTANFRNLLLEASVAQWASNVAGFESLTDEVARTNLLLQQQGLRIGRLELAFVSMNALGGDRALTASESIKEIKSKAYVADMNLRSSSKHFDDWKNGGSSSPPLGFSGELDPGVINPPTFLSEVAYGKDIAEDLITEILHGQYVKWVGTWAMGGAGKTFVAKRIFNDARIRQHFDGGTFWVTVGQKQTSSSLLRHLFKQVSGNGSVLPDDLEQARKILRETLNEKKVMLVLDDVWSHGVLEWLDLVSESERGVFFVTTRNEGILRKKFAKSMQIPMLPPEDSWQLFSWHAFHGVGNVPTLVKDIARQVAMECNGLPLALTVLGSTMAGKTTLPEWEVALKRLRHASVLSEEHEKQLFGRLQLSVDDLCAVDPRLKDCFYYFAAFPEDEEVNPSEQMVSVWIAEGIVGTDVDSPVSGEEEAYELLGWLIARSMIELFDGEVESRSCRVHDVLRDLARFNLENDLDTRQKLKADRRKCLYRPGLQLDYFPDDWLASSRPEPQVETQEAGFLVERLSFMANELVALPSEFNAPHLRVLLLGNNAPLQTLPKGFFKQLQQLRVLDLQRTGITGIPGSVFSSIKALVQLNLTGCDFLQEIPESIRGLGNLIDLRVGYCRKLTKLPKGLTSLKLLKNLDTFGTEVWERRKALDNVMFKFPGRQKAFTLDDVSSLTALRSVTISCSGSFFPHVESHKPLEKLTLESEELRVLPTNAADLLCLRVLVIYSCKKLTCLGALDDLPNLEHLQLEDCRSVTTLPTSFGRSGGFPSLKRLELYDCVRFRSIPEFHAGAMPQIRHLTLLGLANLLHLPESFRVLTTLVSVNLSSCDRLQSLEPAFSDPSCFPDLETLHLYNTKSLRHLPAALALFPNLRRLSFWLNGPIRRDNLPDELIELERQKRLEIDFFPSALFVYGR